MAVLNKHRLPGKQMPPGAVYIGRGSKWGNPWVIGKDGTREEVIEKYRTALWDWVKKEPEQATKALAELHGKDLVCFCKPAPCHGDVLEAAAAWAYKQLNGKDR